MAPDQAAPVPAGWYPDPYAVSELRWWDGQNWTESVHPPAAPQPAAPVAAPEPTTAEPVPAEPVAVPDPVAAPTIAVVPEIAVASEAPTMPEAAPASLDFPPPAHPAPHAWQPATPPMAVDPAPLIEPAPTDGLPSRRELRARTASATGDGSGPAGTSGSAPGAPPPAPVSNSSEPSSFDWLPGGAALGTGASISAVPTSAAPLFATAEPTVPVPSPLESPPAPPAPPAQSPSSLAAVEPAAPLAGSTDSVPILASSAWAQEPASTTTDDLYSNAATRKATVSGWFIALMPLFAGILSIAAVKGAENYPRYIPATFEWWMLAGGVVVVLYLVTILLAVADRSKLDWASYARPAHWAWAVLTAPVYLLVRTIAVKRETGRNSALLWVWLLLAAALIGAWFATDYFMPELLAPYALPFL